MIKKYRISSSWYTHAPTLSESAHSRLGYLKLSRYRLQCVQVRKCIDPDRGIIIGRHWHRARGGSSTKLASLTSRIDAYSVSYYSSCRRVNRYYSNFCCSKGSFFEKFHARKFPPRNRSWNYLLLSDRCVHAFFYIMHCVYWMTVKLNVKPLA